MDSTSTVLNQASNFQQVELRSTSRVPYVEEFFVAPQTESPPKEFCFESVIGRDLSVTGISFYSNSCPASDKLLLRFGQNASFTFVRADVVHVGYDADSNRYVVGCGFCGRKHPLQFIIDAWQTMPESVKSEILAMV